MSWNLPISVEIDGTEYAIRNKCDYRVILDVIEALNDEELEMEYRVQCALFIFYEDLSDCADVTTAINEMMKIINNGDEEQDSKPKIMDWKHDFKHIVSPISRVLGYSVRSENNYTHWYDFIGAYQEIGECFWANIISVRSKRMEGKALDEWERKFYAENRKLIDLPHKLTDEEQEWLDADW